jgi:hypothetical protein
MFFAERGHPVYLLLESWEEPQFKERFAGVSSIGRLDWPASHTWTLRAEIKLYELQGRPVNPATD